MFVRLTFLQIPAERAEEAKSVYNNEMVPVIKEQKGNEAAMLLEPKDGGEEYVSYTQWQSEEDIKTFEASPNYGPVMGKIKAIATNAKPKYYNVVS